MKQQAHTNDLSQRSGLSILTDKNIKSLMRLPMLEAVHAKFTHDLLMPLKEAFNTEIFIESSPTKVQEFDEYINDAQNKSVFCVVKSAEFIGKALIHMHDNFVYTCIDILLGGKKRTEHAKIEKRNLTNIELEIVRYIADILTKTLVSAFSIVSNVHFSIERMENDHHNVTAVKHDDIINILSIKCKIADRHCTFDLILPHATLEPIRKLLAQPYIADRVWQDPVWFRHFERELHNIDVKVELILDGSVSKVQELLNLKVGNTIVLDKFAEEPLDISVNGVKVSMGKLGKAGDKVAVQLIDDINITKFNNIV